MKRTPEGANAGGGGGENIGLAGGDHPDGGGGAILLVVGMEQENEIERPDDFRLQLVVLAGQREHHVQEVLSEFKIGFRIARWQSCGFAIGTRGDGAGLRNEPRSMDRECLLERLVTRLRTRIGRGCVDHRRENRHRMSLRRKRAEVMLHVLVQHLIFRELPGKFLKFGSSGKLAVDQ